MTPAIFAFMRFAFIFFGDQILIKWISAARIWFFSITDPILKKKLEDDYQRALTEWNDYTKDRDR